MFRLKAFANSKLLTSVVSSLPKKQRHFNTRTTLLLTKGKGTESDVNVRVRSQLSASRSRRCSVVYIAAQLLFVPLSGPRLARVALLAIVLYNVMSARRAGKVLCQSATLLRNSVHARRVFVHSMSGGTCRRDLTIRHDCFGQVTH